MYLCHIDLKHNTAIKLLLKLIGTVSVDESCLQSRNRTRNFMVSTTDYDPNWPVLLFPEKTEHPCCLALSCGTQ